MSTKPQSERRYWWFDTSLCIGSMDDRPIYDALLKRLRQNGFRVGQNQRVSRIIRSGYHIGNRGDLYVQGRHYPTGAQIEFYQELVTDNPHGGYYDFDKLDKMPYLIRMRFLYEKRCLEGVLERRGFTNVTKPSFKLAMPFIEQKRKEITEWHRGIYDKPPTTWNATDADGQTLRDGDIRYFYTYGGSLRRGTIYYNLNNMWWAVVNRHEFHNIAAFRFFAYKGQPVRQPADDPSIHIKKALDHAVREQNFERAIGLRDALKRITRLEAAAA